MFEEKLKNSPINKNFTFCLKWLGILLFALIAGCAHKPFGLPVEGDEYGRKLQDYHNYRNRSNSCLTSLDGDLTVSLDHSLQKLSFSGYFRTLLPASLAFTALTPLNQPLFAVSSNGKWFQYVNATKRLYQSGSLRSFSVRHKIPINVLAGEWGTWFTGRPLSLASQVLSIHDDTENRGTWFSIARSADDPWPLEHVLVNFHEQKIMARILNDRKGGQDATIIYEAWQEMGACLQPTSLSISGLSFGGTATLRLSDIQERSPLNDNDFNLPIPRGYKRQFLP